ncbi:MAG: Gfo/Idh/MocA family protein [Anaerolineae bacterium]
MTGPVRLAVVGGNRGAGFGEALRYLADQLRLVAVCDLSPEVLEAWEKKHGGIRTYTSYDELLQQDDVDAVLLATPMELHAPQALQALRAGKHVLSEVIAATTMEECWQLVEAVKTSKRVYMLAENYCYSRENMMVLNMVQQGLFGELTYAEGGYIHDCRDLNFDSEGRLTWRGRLRRRINGNFYPTHSLGPIAQWLGINRPGGDRFVTTATFMTAARASQLWVREHLGADHPAARDDYWLCGDSATTIIQTAKGAVIVLRKDSSSPRPHNGAHYVLEGTRGAYLSRRYEGDEPLIWSEALSAEVRWQPMASYADAWDHPYWQAWRQRAEGAGHGGGDYFVLHDFVTAIQQGTPPAIDVYDAVTWSSIMPLSIESVSRGSVPVEVPVFR